MRIFGFCSNICLVAETCLSFGSLCFKSFHMYLKDSSFTSGYDISESKKQLKPKLHRKIFIIHQSKSQIDNELHWNTDVVMSFSVFCNEIVNVKKINQRIWLHFQMNKTNGRKRSTLYCISCYIDEHYFCIWLWYVFSGKLPIFWADILCIYTITV